MAKKPREPHETNGPHDPMAPRETPLWLSGNGPMSDVVISSRARLARNLAGYPFVTRADRADRMRIFKICKDWIPKSHLAAVTTIHELHTMSAQERMLLVERHAISKPLAKGKTYAGETQEPKEVSHADPRGLAVAMDHSGLSVMINEEDHLRMQVIRPGLDLASAWESLNRADDQVEAGLDYAFHQEYGYLTACPTNVGTGLRLSCMLHLPALKVVGEMEKVKSAANDMSLAVRGFYGEGSESVGDLYQISNQTALGKTETQILHTLVDEIIPRVIDYERVARKTLLAKRKIFIEDQVHRALGTLTHAHLLGTEESMQLISQVRLGVSLGLIDHVSIESVSSLFLLVQPAHLQKIVGQELDQDARKEARAALVRQKLR